MRVKGRRLGGNRRLRDVFQLKKQHRAWQKHSRSNSEDSEVDAASTKKRSNLKIPYGYNQVESYDESRNDHCVHATDNHVAEKEVRIYKRLELAADNAPIVVGSTEKISYTTIIVPEEQKRPKTMRAPIVAGTQANTMNFKTATPKDVWGENVAVDQENQVDDEATAYNCGSAFTDNEPSAQFVVQGTIEMKSENEISGIIFNRSDSNSPLKIKSFARGSLFLRTPLSPGMTVLDINGKEMMWKSPAEAVAEIQRARPGMVTIKAIAPSSVAQAAQKKEGSAPLVNTSVPQHLKKVIANVINDGGIAIEEIDMAFEDPPINTMATDTTEKLDKTASLGNEGENRGGGSTEEYSLAGSLLGSKFVDGSKSVESEDYESVDPIETHTVAEIVEEGKVSLDDDEDLDFVNFPRAKESQPKKTTSQRPPRPPRNSSTRKSSTRKSSTRRREEMKHRRQPNSLWHDLLFMDNNDPDFADYTDRAPRSPTESSSTTATPSFVSFTSEDDEYEDDSACTSWEYHSRVVAPLKGMSQFVSITEKYLSWVWT